MHDIPEVIGHLCSEILLCFLVRKPGVTDDELEDFFQLDKKVGLSPGPVLVVVLMKIVFNDIRAFDNYGLVPRADAGDTRAER